MVDAMAQSLKSIVDRLAQSRTLSDRARERSRLALLRSASKAPLGDAAAIKAYHDQLLFLRAFPDSQAVSRAAKSEHARLLTAVNNAWQTAPARFRKSLLNSAIVGTVSEGAFSLQTIDWLLTHFPRDVEFEWDDDVANALETWLDKLALHVECDGLLDDSLSTRAWMKHAFGGSHRWLLQFVRQLQSMDASPTLVDAMIEPINMNVRWRIRARRSTARLMQFPSRPCAVHPSGLERAMPADRMLEDSLPKSRRISQSDAQRLIDCARATLVARQRETDPITYANPREVSLDQLERGVDVALFGMQPDRRLPIESYIGYLAAKNGQPIAYGGAWIFYRRAEIGINIFDSFRGGESAFIFTQIMRVYRQRFGIMRFLVDPYQFGADNAEGLRSGAFWFYYRLGFRPIADGVCALAEHEWKLISANRKYRSPLRTLRRLASDKLALDLAGDAQSREPDLAHLGLAVSFWVGSRHAGDRTAAMAHATLSVRRALGVRSMTRWPAEERGAFERWCPLVVQISDLARWTRIERQNLLALMRAKGGPRERDFLNQLSMHDRFRNALTEIANRAQRKLNRLQERGE